MHDIKFIRENSALFDAAMARRSFAPLSSEILDLDAQNRAIQTKMQEAQATRNDLSRQIGELKRKGENADEIMAEVAKMKEDLSSLEQQARDLGARMEERLSTLPNILADDVPDGKDEANNKELRRWGAPPVKENAKEHYEIGEGLGLMDFERAAKLSGARFVVLSGQLARLERALGAFMLDLHTQEYGYTEMSPPLLVNDDTCYGTGQLPKFSEDLFKTTTGHWLIPTAEVPLTNLVRGEILAEEELPLRMTARTPCFRSEAGSAGKDTRGMLRQHQFWKVELVSITTPEKSQEEHERMTDCAESVLKKLELPFRTIVLCSGDTGFGARKTYDIEAWLPGQDTYREISSCSNCWDFQARRMNARYRPQGEKATKFVHTLNGSGIAVGRALIAVMENYVNPDGSISVPDVLVPYMNGLTKIESK